MTLSQEIFKIGTAVNSTYAFKDWQAAKCSGDWGDWRWQFKNRLQTIQSLEERMQLTHDEREALQQIQQINLPVAITPYYFELMDLDDPQDPIRKTMIPQQAELSHTSHEMNDPCGEDTHSPVRGLVHRYPDRVLFLIDDTCAVYCRYCTRSRVVGSHSLTPEYEAVYQYLENHTEIRDVLISGGDPLIFSDDRLEQIISRLRQIPHIELVRIGTKIPVVMPQRITPELVDMLKKYHPLMMSIHFIHPCELTPEVRIACNRLADAGIPTFSQTVLLKGVNDCPNTMKKLVQQLLTLRVRPYYLYQCDPVKGTSHFRTTLETGLDIIQSLRGHTTGYAIPTYVIDAPGGGGKIPVSPDYVIAHDEHQTLLKNYANEVFVYHHEP